MAFAFSQIMGQMGAEDEDQQQRSNVFGGDTQQQTLPAEKPKPYSAQNAWQEQRLGEKRAYEAAAGKTATPSAVGGVAQQIQTNQANLQNQANQYVQAGQAQQNYGVGNNAIKNAIGGNELSFGRISKLLNRGNIRDVEDFQAPDVNAQDAKFLENDAGLRQLAARGQDVRYTPGMANFDVKALHMTPGFDREVSSLRERNNNLQTEADTTGERVKKEVSDYGTQNLAAAKKKVTEALSGKKSSLEAKKLLEASEYNAAKNATNVKGLRGTAKKEAAAKAKVALGGLIPGVGNFVPKDVDASKYVKLGADLNGDAFISEKEANQYNNIQKLMGTGGKSWMAAGKRIDPTKNYEVDEAGLNKAMREGINKNFGDFKTMTGKEIEAIKKRYGDDIAKRVAEEVRLAKDPKALRELGNEAFKGSNLYENMSKYYRDDLVDPSKFLKKTGKVDWKDLVNSGDAKKLNELAASIGEVGGVNEGRLSKGLGDVFDKEGYLKALQEQLYLESGKQKAANLGKIGPAARKDDEAPASTAKPTSAPKIPEVVAKAAKNVPPKAREEARKARGPMDNIKPLEQAKKIVENPAKYVAEKKGVANKIAGKAGNDVAKVGKGAAAAAKNAVIALAKNAVDHKKMDPKGGGFKKLAEVPAKTVEQAVRKLPTETKKLLGPAIGGWGAFNAGGGDVILNGKKKADLGANQIEKIGKDLWKEIKKIKIKF